ncbi:hypothetical protein [Parabacteroides sp. MSK.9.14]|uniref:hypothetical protein n=1 Tax=Parabacteroides sp. MSK.9.14 TaxID=2849180 RepID=UPI0020B2BF0D|nr:hypothetical protein [Parabacteroides sp. MSK.9.14]
MKYIPSAVLNSPVLQLPSSILMLKSDFSSALNSSSHCRSESRRSALSSDFDTRTITWMVRLSWIISQIGIIREIWVDLAWPRAHSNTARV